jgi:hypothetical protein
MSTLTTISLLQNKLFLTKANLLSIQSGGKFWELRLTFVILTVLDKRVELKIQMDV